MKLRKIISGIKFKFFAPAEKIEFINFLGKDLQLIKGTVRLKPDKDDAWYFELAKKANCILDIGANIGFNSILACIANEKSKIFLVEPNPKALSAAAQNMIYNGFSHRCNFQLKLLTDRANDSIQFFTLGFGAAGSIFRTHAHTASALNSFSWITTYTVDLLVEENNFLPDFVKIDVEGAEHLVLEGATALAEKKSTIFMVEMHSTKESSMKNNAQKIINWCNSNNYKAWYMKEAKPLENSELIAQRGRCHLLLQPDEWQYPDFLRTIKEGEQIRSNH